MSTYNEIFLGGAIKSIQRGSVSVPVGNTTVTITSVNPAKTELRLLGSYHGGGSTFDDLGANIRLSSATTISCQRGGASGVIAVSWELTEYY